MIPRRIGIFAANDESLRLLPLLARNPEVEVVRVYAADSNAALERARAIGSEVATELEARLVPDTEAFLSESSLDAVVDASSDEAFSRLCPSAGQRGLQIVTPLTARLLWGYGSAKGDSVDRKADLLRALSEVVESVELTIDSRELFSRMLEIAVGVTGADGGSLMLLDEAAGDLRVRVAIGVEPELWPKIRVAIGDGIAGRVAAEARPILLRGRADQTTFQIVRERLDIESALCAPLIHDDRVLGVLNLHHSTRPDAFGQEDLAFVEQLAQLDAQIIARAQEHQTLRDRAARYTTACTVRDVLAGPEPLLERLRHLCTYAANRAGGGIASIYLYDADEDAVMLAATSLEGGNFGGEYRIVNGQGIDGRVAETHRPTLLRDQGGALAYASMPLLSGATLIGVMTVQAGGGPSQHRAPEDELLEMASALAEGVAQSNKETRSTTRATRLSAINESGLQMISAEELTDVIRLATSSVALILDAEHAVLRLQDERTRRYVIRSYFGPADGRQQERLFRLDKRLSVETIKRRTPLLIRDTSTDERLGDPPPEDFRSLLAAPLKHGGQVVGTLCLYDKVAADRFYPGRFNEDDMQVFSKYVSYVERAVEAAMHRFRNQDRRSLDRETGLPNAAYFNKRIAEELARGRRRENALAIALCRIENLDEIEGQCGPAMAQRVIHDIAESLRAHLRDFDVLARSGRNELVALLPEPGPVAGDRVFGLARAAGDAVTRDDDVDKPVRVALAFGYATYPVDGEDRETLLARAREARIRMV